VAGDDRKLSRLQVVLTRLLEHHLASSLGDAHQALERWKAGELSPLEAHAAVLEHAARAERLAARVATVGPSAVRTALRDAFDAELIDRDEFIDLAGCPPEEVEPAPALDHPAASAPGKRPFVDELLERGPVLVHIDARRDEADVPERFRGDPKLVLRFGYGLSPAITDLEVDDEGISGTLTFGGVPHHCVLRWPAVYAAVSEVDQRGMVWPDDVPPVVLQQMRAEEEGAAPAGPTPVEGSSAAKEQGSAPGSKGRPHLKLVE
jgi:stringent starvation protein B